MSSVLASGVIDSHVHLWDRGVLTYRWLDGLGIDGPYRIDDVPTFVAGAELDGFVFVQAECRESESFDEVEWVLDQGANGRRGLLRGIVAKVDLTSPRAPADIRRLGRVPPVVGVRHNIQGRPRGFAQTLRGGIDGLAAEGLAFDLCCLAAEMDDVSELVESCDPQARLALDHLGKPAVGDLAGFDAWAGRLSRLAEAPNLYCKLSGLQTELPAGRLGRPQDFEPYLSHAVGAFGIDRVMYGSDWPVCTLNGSMSAWAGAVAAAVGDDEAAHRKVFHDNAVRFYRLDGRG